jgi:hypothetical protein
MINMSDLIILLSTLCTGVLIGALIGWTDRDKQAQKFEAELGEALLKHYENCPHLEPVLRRIK